MADLIVYEVSPIDHWDGWIDLKKHRAADFAGEYSQPDRYQSEVDQFLRDAKRVASEVLLWEGDMTQGPFLSALPDPSTCSSNPVLAWKQSNNGTTYIASRVPLRHLEEDGGYDAGILTAGETKKVS